MTPQAAASSRSSPKPRSLKLLATTGLGIAHPGGETRVYVGEREESGNYVVAVFDATGALLETWNGADTPSGSFGRSGFFDVTVNGAAPLVYVADGEANAIDVLKPKAGGREEYVTQLTGPEIGVPFSLRDTVSNSGLLTVDPLNGDLLVVETESLGGAWGNTVVDILEPAGLDEYALAHRLTGTPAVPFYVVHGVASDGANGDVYVRVEEADHAQVIDQFDSTGKYVGQLTGTASGLFKSPQSIAVDPATHHVYVGDSRANPAGGVGTEGVIDVFGPNSIVPDVTLEPVSAVGPERATLNGAVNPDSAGEATCEFEYGTTAAYGSRAPCTKPVPEGNAVTSVQAEITGLQPDTVYHYRLDAHNQNGIVNTGQGPEDEGTFKTEGPGIESESVSEVTASSATLNTVIEPDNSPTSYYFEYGRTTEYGSQTVRAPVGSGEGDASLAAHIRDLEAGALYHYRVVAVSQLAGGTFESDGADRTFVTQRPGGFTLPDGRNWEMVSPPNKQSGAIVPIGEETPIVAAADGSAISYVATAPTESDPRGYTNLMQVFSWRDPAHQDWSSSDIEVPHQESTGGSVGLGEEYRVFSADLSLSIVQPFGAFNPELSEEATEQTPYLRHSYGDVDGREVCANSCFHPLVTSANVSSGTAFGVGECARYNHPYCGPEFVGGTSDLKYVVITSQAALTTVHVQNALYEWHEGELRLVSILPRGEGGSAVGGRLGDAAGQMDVRNAVSADGSRIVWSVDGKLYMRDMTRGESGETVRLDASPGSADTHPFFQFASSDGSRVFFVDSDRLTPDSGAEQEKPDLYECEIVEVAGALTCKLSDLTPGHSGEVAAVEGLMIGGSLDGSYVYFAASGALAPGAHPGNCTTRAPAEALCNLYVWHNGATKFVAAVAAHGDHTDWGASEYSKAVLPELTARVSPSGNWFAFASQRSLTGYDNRDAISGQPDEEVYLYGAQSETLKCASCDPSGARPTGTEGGEVGERLVTGNGVWSSPSSWLAATIPGWTPLKLNSSVHQSRYLSDSGRLFFNSSDALVPKDVNGTWDVYEFEPSGVGSCTVSSASYSQTTDGCVGAISSGSSAEESAFLDASETGGDVFFLTGAKLAAQDYDTARDVYDAHECSSTSPCFATTPPSPPACTTTEACRAAPTPQPQIFGSPSSATFAGAGNPVPSLESRPAAKQRSLTRAQKLGRALKACKARPRGRRAACKRRARKTYGAKQSSKSTKKAGR